MRVPSRWRTGRPPRRAGVRFLCVQPRGRQPGETGYPGGGGSFAGRFRLRACAALWSACLPLLLFGCPLFRCRWPSPAGALGVGVGATLLSAAPSLVLLRTSVSATHCCCDVRIRRRALFAGAFGAGQCAAASCLSVGSVVRRCGRCRPISPGGRRLRGRCPHSRQAGTGKREAEKRQCNPASRAESHGGAGFPPARLLFFCRSRV